MKKFWDERFSQEEYIYGKEPNLFLKETLLGMPAGKLLLPGEGEGRNAVWAALNGWEVLAIDYSVSGQKKALELAKNNKVKINYDLQDLEEMNLPDNTFDAIALIYVHLPETIRQKVHNELLKSLKPSGILILEAFHKSQLNYNSGGPKDASLLYNADILKKDFAALDTVLLTEKHIILEEGSWHKGEASVVQYIGKKQAAE